MGYAAVIASVYLMFFFPGFYSRPLLVFPFAVMAILFLTASRKDPLPVLLAVLVFSAITRSLSVSMPSFSASTDDVSAISGVIIQDSQIRSGRRFGYRILAETVMDSRGSVFEASGCVYISSPDAALYYGDEIASYGYFSEGVFHSSSTRLLMRPYAAAIRMKLIATIKRVFMSFGECGELASLLVLGTGSDGDFPLSGDARSSGLSHVLALSGMHLSIIAYIISPVLYRLMGRRIGKAALYSVLFSFSFLSGWRPSLMRAFFFRLLLEMDVGLEHGFLLSFPILLMLFPESSSDLGAIYSFLSLGGIFLLSGKLDEALRMLSPFPSFIASSMAASGAALVFSIPVTICVFGHYTIWAVITSFPFNAAISLYMVIALFSLFLPFLSNLMDLLYFLLAKGFGIAGSLPESEGLLHYLMLLLCISLLIAASNALKRLVAK